MRGQADYGMYAPKAVTTSISDMGEVAARLGSIVTYDKRGDVVDFDNFESPLLRWAIVEPHAGTTVRLNSENAKSGSQSVKLHTGNIDSAYAYMEKGYLSLLEKRLGLEISFSISGTDCYLYFGSDFYDGARVWYPVARVDPLTGQLAVKTGLVAYTEVAVVGKLDAFTFWFHTLKLVADLETGYYKRLLFDLSEYDILDKAIFSLPTIATPYFLPYAHSTNRAAVGGDIWVDDFVFTQAEP